MREQIDAALRWARDSVTACSESPGMDAELLLAHCLDKPRSFLYGHPEYSLSDSCWQRYQALVRERRRPTPIAYLLGRREFYSMEFATTPCALVPRPETELLVGHALQQIPEERCFKLCDLGTGSGIIAITLKKLRPNAIVYATDIDPACVALARVNARSHDTEIEFIESDWYQQFPQGLKFDLIVSNPPYIAANHPFLSQGDLPGEPQIALTPGTTGLEALQQIISQAPSHLVNGGGLILEHGYDQPARVTELLLAHGFGEIRCETDHSELPRNTIAKLVENQNTGRRL